MAENRGNRILHIAAGNSAGGCLRQAVRHARKKDDVLSWPDDLSCGPIASDSPSSRAEWWAPFFGDWDIEADLDEFWKRVSTTNDRLIVWFGRHSASEFAFFLAWAHRLGDRPYDVVDVTELRFPLAREDGSTALSDLVGAVGMVNPDRLRTLLDCERPIKLLDNADARQLWSRLKEENAPFRIVTASGMVSAPIDYFDSALLGRATPEWKRLARVIGETMAYTDESYIQVGHLMLQSRVVALITEGKLLTDGDPWDMPSCRVRLPT